MVADAATAAIVFLAVSVVRFGDGEWMEIWNRIGIDIRQVAILFGLTWMSALWLVGLYRLRTRWQFRSEAKDILRATILVAALTLSSLFIFKEGNVSRLFLVILFLVQPLVTLSMRAVMRIGLTRLRETGRNTHFMLVVGTGRLAREFADKVEDRGGLGIRVIGHLSVPDGTTVALRRPILGSVDDIDRVFHDQVVDEVAVCLEPNTLHYLDPVTRLAADEGKVVRVPIDPIGLPLPNAREEEFEGYIVRSLAFDQEHDLGLAAKRLVDVGGALAGLILLSPLLLWAALAIRRREGSPVLFSQTRVGLNGRTFTLYKFRSMVCDAEAHKDDVRHLNERSSVMFKSANDPRITRIGRTLRATSIDELPQLWNVLRGDMSLVGPRPSLPEEVAEFDIWHRRRMSMKPGLTGLWQVEARHEPDFDRWVERDLDYIDRWSLLLDFQIIMRTVPVVLGRTGA